MTRSGIEHWSRGPLANTQLIRPMVRYSKRKVGDRSRGRPEGSLFNSYYIDVLGRALLLSLDCSTLPLIRTLYRRVLRKWVSSTIFKIFGLTRLNRRSPRPLANTLPFRPMSRSCRMKLILSLLLLVWLMM